MNSLYVFIMFILPCFFGGLGAVLRCAMTKKFQLLIKAKFQLQRYLSIALLHLL